MLQVIRSGSQAKRLPTPQCKLCGALSGENRFALKGIQTLICDNCIHEITSNLPEVVSNK